jgi:outer membrane lipoprotein-sorting protein
MFIKKISVITLLIAGITTSIIAQNDPKAKSILDDLSAKTKAYTSIKAEFSFTIEKKDKSKEVQNGKIQTKGSKYKLEIPGHEIYCDGKTLWDYIKEANEVQIKDAETDKEDGISPTTIFTMYEKGFKYKFESETATQQVIALFPDNPDKKKYHTVKLYIDKTKKQISMVKMMMKDGSTHTYEIKKFETNTAIPDTDFAFNTKAHPGISIEDLR